MRVADLERHYGRTCDSCCTSAFGALQLARPGDALSMIFNDSIFTSADADDFRRTLIGGPDGGVTLPRPAHVVSRAPLLTAG